MYKVTNQDGPGRRRDEVGGDYGAADYREKNTAFSGLTERGAHLQKRCDLLLIRKNATSLRNSLNRNVFGSAAQAYEAIALGRRRSAFTVLPK